MIAAIEKVAQQISAIAPGVSWQWSRDESRSVGCPPPYEQSEGQYVRLGQYYSDVPIAEQHWKQAYDIVADAASSLGATNVTVFRNEPGDHDVNFSSETGTTLRFGTQKAAPLSGRTGCRLARG
jgi:hypothetical protein